MAGLSLRFRLLLLVLVAMAPGVALFAYWNVEDRRQASAAGLEEALHIAELASSHEAQLLESARQLLTTLAQLPGVQSHDATCHTIFAFVMRGTEAYTDLVAAAPNGDAFCGVPSGGLSYRDRAYFQRALRTRAFTVGGYVIGRATGKPRLVLAQPALDASGDVRAVVILGIDLGWLNRLAADARLPEGSVSTVVDSNGVILARYPGPVQSTGRPAETAIVRAMLTQGKGIVTASGLDGVRRFYGFLPLKHADGPAGAVYVAVGIPKDVVLAKANRALVRGLLGLGLVCVVALGGARFAADRLVLRRMRALVDAAKRLGVGDMSARTGLTYNQGELGQLARAFDQMAVSLEAEATHLREAEAKYRALVEQSLVGVYLITGDRLAYINRAGAEMFGYRVDEIVERLDPLDLVHPEDRVLAAKNIRDRLSGVVDAVQYTFRGVRKDGRMIHCEVFGRRILHGDQPAILGTLIDITERTQAVEETRRLNRALRTLGEGSKTLVRATEEPELLGEICRVIVEVGGYRMAWVGFAEQDEAKTVRPAAHAGDDAGCLEAVKMSWADTEQGRSPAGAAIRSASPTVVRDIAADAAFGLWHTEAIARGFASVAALPLIEEGRPFGVLEICDGEVGRFDDEEVTLLTELADDLAYGVVALRARAERLRVEEELKRQREAVYQREKLAEMGSLLAGVAHELNNPLAVVTGRATLLLEAAGDGPLGRQAEKILNAANRCARIVKNFLALARQYPPERQQVSLNRIVEEAVELLAYQLRVSNVEVRLDLAGDLPPLWADPHQLHQVVVNLVTNAEHAMREVAGLRRLSISTRSEPARGRVHVAVADTGPGVPPELHQKIFEPFFTTKPAGQGTGLGLALCRGIVEGHRGVIGVESGLGHGAIFRLELPVETPSGTVSKIEPGALPAIREKTILVVDDEPEVLSMLEEMLSTDGHRVETVTSGTLALAKLKERRYDVILSDMKMPGLDGLGLYREVERLFPEFSRRFIFMTGDALSPGIVEFLERTRAPSLAKPFVSAEAQLVVQRVLRQST